MIRRKSRLPAPSATAPPATRTSWASTAAPPARSTRDAASNTASSASPATTPAPSPRTSVVFPSGIELTDLGDESRCMECHQGRESKVSVDKQITDFKVTGGRWTPS